MIALLYESSELMQLRWKGGTPAPGFTGTRTFCEAPP
jgi:hypothetical protein